MATRAIENHIKPKNVVVFDENILAQQVGEQEEKATINDEIHFHWAKLEIPVRIKKSGLQSR